MSFLKKIRLDLIIYFVLVLIPLSIWALMEPLSLRFSNFVVSMTSIGQLAGILGMTLMALSMVFQIRLCRFFNMFTSKPTTVTNLHHYSGIYSLFFLIIHPLALSLRFLPTSITVAASYLYTTNQINLAGLVALIIMIVSLYFTLFVSRNFKYWKLAHQIMLVAYIFILYHLLFVTSDITRSLPLRSYLLSLTVLGGLAFAWQKAAYYINLLRRRDDREISC